MEWVAPFVSSIIGGIISAMIYAERGRILFHIRQAGLPLKYAFWLYALAGVSSAIGLLLTVIDVLFRIENKQGFDALSTQFITIGVFSYLVAEVVDKYSKDKT
ncbi:MAG: hypothetical protein OQK24_07360 [Magnetovibrio sp.]|nr:hypothetical protein [Magnetovibrio sp.]